MVLIFGETMIAEKRLNFLLVSNSCSARTNISFHYEKAGYEIQNIEAQQSLLPALEVFRAKIRTGFSPDVVLVEPRFGDYFVEYTKILQKEFPQAMFVIYTYDDSPEMIELCAREQFNYYCLSGKKFKEWVDDILVLAKNLAFRN